MNIAAIDTETTGLTSHHGCRPFMIQACDGSHNYTWEGVVDPLDRSRVIWSTKTLQDFLDFADELDVAVFHNAKFDIRMIFKILQDYSLHKGWLSMIFSKFEDTILASHACCSGEPHSLSYLSLKYLDYYKDTEHKLGQDVLQARDAAPPEYDLAHPGHPCMGGLKKTKWYKTDYWLCMEECRKYGTNDVEETLLLWKHVFKPGMEDESLIEPYNTRKKLLEVFYHLEDTGVYFYKDLVDGSLEQLEKKAQQLQKKIETDNSYYSKLDLSKREHLLFLLHEKLEIPVLYHTDTEQPAVNKDALDGYQEIYPEIETIQDLSEYRKTQTQIGDIKSYNSWLCPDQRLRASYWITGTRETRQAVEHPNLQNVGKGIRHLMGPSPGKVWLDYDLVNIEMRRWVYYVGNKEITDVFLSGGSFHLLVASILYPELYEEHGTDFKDVFKSTYYQWIKNGNFSILYGAGSYKANRTYRLKGAYEKIAHRLPEVPAFIQRSISEVNSNWELYNQPCVTVDGNYRLDVPLDQVFKSANYKVQGSAGWIMGEAMIEVFNSPLYKNTSAAMTQQVHDSLVVELDRKELTYEIAEEFKTCIERAGLRYMPTNEASCDIVTHPDEQELTIDSENHTITEIAT